MSQEGSRDWKHITEDEAAQIAGKEFEEALEKEDLIEALNGVLGEFDGGRALIYYNEFIEVLKEHNTLLGKLIKLEQKLQEEETKDPALSVQEDIESQILDVYAEAFTIKNRLKQKMDSIEEIFENKRIKSSEIFAPESTYMKVKNVLTNT